MRLPMGEIRKRFTRSEMALMAWRSAELAANMDRITKDARRPVERTKETEFRDHMTDDKDLAWIEDKLGPKIIERMVDPKTGEVDLRRLTGDEALRYMQTFGIPLVPIMPKH